jgi:hypothetical protein
METARHIRCFLPVALFVIGLLLNTTNPVYADTASTDSDSSVPGIGRLFRAGAMDSRMLSMACFAAPQRSLDETEETYSLRMMIDWLRLKGYRLDGGILPHETDVVYTGFFLETPNRRDAAWVEIYEYPLPSAALTFDSCQSRFAQYVPDFPSPAVRDEYIGKYCQVYRLHNLVLLVDDEMYIRRFDPISRLTATMRKKAFIREFQGYSPGNLDELRERFTWLEKALSLLEGERLSDYEQACDLLDEFEMHTMRDPDLFRRLLRAKAKVGEYARWMEGRITEQMLIFAGPEDAPWLLANGYYQRAVAVGDTATLAALVALADSAMVGDTATTATFAALTDSAIAAAPPGTGEIADTAYPVQVIRAAVDLYFRLAPAEAVPTSEDVAGIVRCLDGELTNSSSVLAHIWRDRYGTDRYRIGEIRVIGAYAGAIVAFPGGGLSGGRIFVYLLKEDGRWRFLTTGWMAIS